MAQMIDRDALIERLNELHQYYKIVDYNGASLKQVVADIVKKIDELPVVELVTCKECKHHKTNSGITGQAIDFCEAWCCDFYDKDYDPTKYFCAEGEKKNG